MNSIFSFIFFDYSLCSLSMLMGDGLMAFGFFFEFLFFFFGTTNKYKIQYNIKFLFCFPIIMIGNIGYWCRPMTNARCLMPLPPHDARFKQKQNEIIHCDHRPYTRGIHSNWNWWKFYFNFQPYGKWLISTNQQQSKVFNDIHLVSLLHQSTLNKSIRP